MKERKLDKQKSKVIGMLNALTYDASELRMFNGDFVADRLRAIIAEVGKWPEKPI